MKDTGKAAKENENQKQQIIVSKNKGFFFLSKLCK
jgi:hypothetical protein